LFDIKDEVSYSRLIRGCQIKTTYLRRWSKCQEGTEQGLEARDQAQVEVKVRDNAAAVAGQQGTVDIVSAQTAEKKLPTRWANPVMNRNAQSAALL